MNLELKILQPNEFGDFKKLIQIFEEVFGVQNFTLPSEQHLIKLLNKETFYAIIAKTEDQIIGGLTAYVIDQYYSERPWAYILDLAVLVKYQRKGVGRKLVAFTNQYFKEKGFEEVFVQADEVDAYALDFYRLTQPTEEEKVRHFYYKLTPDH
ncbi:GNAT family N-acetyltransferase [Cecembia calidifontis]|jgi:aminoglycoside 3-N-acetyltransferase I|uniref:Aminoglycoside 3-N-acetyltransferase I n=1 Tax=Cecembia calidifontis TaxID=1187080 RepID=A0A4Q7P8E4_9BACT|nr:GNAT family N-acetyltransferase [Cecembia calidifontis]RZS96365.1 aminoglycoside 3-N-acetyltransferase I [Cecembia calidifontis]